MRVATLPTPEHLQSEKVLTIDGIGAKTSIVFQVMIQKHNRHMSFSLYISVLAITDTITLLAGKSLSYFMFGPHFVLVMDCVQQMIFFGMRFFKKFVN